MFYMHNRKIVKQDKNKEDGFVNNCEWNEIYLFDKRLNNFQEVPVIYVKCLPPVELCLAAQM